MKYKGGYYIAALWIVLLVGFRVDQKRDFKGSYNARYYDSRGMIDTIAPTTKVSITAESYVWQNNLAILEHIAKKLRSSDLPSREVAFITDSLMTPLYRTIANGLAAADTTTKKKSK